jgi:hypothetical protein
MLAALAIVGAISFVAPDTCAREDPPLLRLAAAKFPSLTPAERSMLRFSDAANFARGQIAAAGSSVDPNDPANDPSRAEEWSHDRDINASPIMWLCEDSAAGNLINRRGIRVLGARITGTLDLSKVRVPFALVMRRCLIMERLILVGAEIQHLDLDGSYVGETDAKGMVVHGDLNLGNGFHASGETRLETVKVEGDLNGNGGSFRYSSSSLSEYSGSLEPALILDDSTFGGSVELSFGFRAEGAVLMREALVADDLDMMGAQLSNPHNAALRANFSTFSTGFLGPPSAGGRGLSKGGVSKGSFEADGRVELIAATVRSALVVNHARFLGAPGDGHGFIATGIRTAGLVWQNVELDNGAIVELSNARVGFLIDERESWPQAGNLLIDGLTYDNFGAGAPADARARLQWISLQYGGFRPQPYRQLAKVLADRGDDAGATQVRIAAEDIRYASRGPLARVWGGFLKWTIGYGHRPMLTIMWSALVVSLGWSLVWMGNRAGVMRRTYPENTPGSAADRYEDLYLLLYSLDVFLPFVNLHQEHYWWPDGRATGDFAVLGGRVPIRGSILRCYLWLQIIAGWILSAIFLAGVTGLIRGD